LVEFASVVNAMRCAVAIQRGMITRNADVPTEKRIEFRIGINAGDIIIEGGDIFGDGVNIAAGSRHFASLAVFACRTVCEKIPRINLISHLKMLATAAKEHCAAGTGLSSKACRRAGAASASGAGTS